MRNLTQIRTNTNMSSQFVPHVPEKMITAQIFRREAVLLKTLRRSSFGEFTVYKANGLIIRIVTKDSKVIEDEPIDLE